MQANSRVMINTCDISAFDNGEFEEIKEQVSALQKEEVPPKVSGDQISQFSSFEEKMAVRMKLL